MTGGGDKRFYDWNFWGNIGSACALSKVNLFYESVFFFMIHCYLVSAFQMRFSNIKHLDFFLDL